MYETGYTFEAGSQEERMHLNAIETDYQDSKPKIREIFAERLTDAYKAVFSPEPSEKIKLEHLIKEKSPESVLEVGAGNDTTYQRFIDQVKRYIRSDLSENQLNQVHDDRVENLVYNGVRHPLEDSSLDAVFSKCVLHHIDNGCAEGRERNRINFLKEQKRLIKDDGRVYCMDVYEPSKNNAKGKLWHLLKHRLILGEEEHNFLTAEEAVELFEKAGFKDVRYEEVDTYKGKYFIVSGGN